MGIHSNNSKSPIERRTLFYSFLFVIVVLASLMLVALMECTARYLYGTSNNNIIPDARSNHKWRPYGKKMHKDWVQANPEFSKPFLHVYNKQGWLEKYDVELKKPENTYRIFYVGDSFVEGTVPMDQSVPSIVEKYLKDHFATENLNFEVINTGTTSYSPIIYYILIRYVISQYAPDLIVVNIDMTDYFDDNVYKQNLIVDSEGNPFAASPVNIFSVGKHTLLRLSFWNRMQLFLYDRSMLYRLLYDLFIKNKKSYVGRGMVRKRFDDDSNKWAWVQHSWSRETDENVCFTMDVLERIAKYCKNKRIKLLFTSSPHYNQLIFGEDGQRVWSIRPHEEIKNVAQKQEIPYLDSVAFLEPYIRNSGQTDYYYRDDVHFNPRGFKLWASAHIRALLDPDNRLMPDLVYSDKLKTLDALKRRLDSIIPASNENRSLGDPV